MRVPELGFHPGFPDSKTSVLSPKSRLKRLCGKETGRGLSEHDGRGQKGRGVALGPGEGAGRVPSALGVILSKPSWVGRSANLEEFPPGDATTSGGSPDTLFVVGIPRGGGGGDTRDIFRC